MSDTPESLESQALGIAQEFSWQMIRKTDKGRPLGLDYRLMTTDGEALA